MQVPNRTKLPQSPFAKGEGKGPLDRLLVVYMGRAGHYTP